jgi:hypothetical protein
MAITRGHWRRIGLTTAGLTLAMLATEIGLRAGLKWSTWDRLGNPAVYFDPLCDEDHWRALRRGAWAAELHTITPSEQHPTLGWLPAEDSLDARGALTIQGAPLDPQQTIALFGDSYTAGTTPAGTRISDALQRLRPQAQILNFGVGGYGLDQILLRLEDRLGVLNPGDQVLIGVLTTDLDRTILPLRDAPKPWFSLSSAGDLTLHPPAQGSTTQWFASHPIAATSLLWRRVIRTAQLQSARSAESTKPDCQVQEKTELSHALLSRMGAVCRDAGLHCTLLSLHRPIDLAQGGGWRAELLHSAQTHGLKLIDTAALMRDLEGGWAEMYGRDNHPSAAGNQQLARWIDRALSESDEPRD